MRPGRLLLVVFVVAGLFAASIGAGYIVGQGAFRPAPPSIRVPNRPAPGPPPSQTTSPAAASTAQASSPAAARGVPGGSSGTPSSPSGTGSPEAAPATPPTAAPLAPGSTAPATTTSPIPIPPGAPIPGGTPAPSPAAAPPPPPAPPSEGAISPPPVPGRFHVQVGVFDARQNAEALALRLRSLGYAVTLVEGPPYRVWVGAYLDQSTAQRLADNLGKAGFDAILTPR